MKTFLPLLALLSLAALCPAPIISPRRGGSPTPERSQAQLTKEQGLNGAYAVVGKVPTKEAEAAPNAVPTGGGERAVASASAQVAASGAGTISTATERVTREAHAFHLPAWLLALGAGVLALGAVRGLKLWADKTLPTGPPTRR